jgi:glycosyltransferase involved in cell wall biosynthesis
MAGFSRRGRLYEAARNIARKAGERDPFVRMTARRSAIALATTADSAARLKAVGARDVRIYSESGVSTDELDEMATYRTAMPAMPRFISIGRLLHWKGFHLGLQAFARLERGDAEYWVIGEGPERDALRELAAELGIEDRVTFWGSLPRSVAFEKLGQATALVHPSLHDSGGMVCLEAMACGRPVICLDLGGPGMQVTEEAGFKVAATDHEAVIDGLASAMRALAADPGLAASKGRAAAERVTSVFLWPEKARWLAARYAEVAPRGSDDND